MKSNQQTSKKQQPANAAKPKEKTPRPIPFVEREQPRLLKIIFWVLAAAIFVAMPLMSLNSGISGDEFVNYEHAGYVYDYYAIVSALNY